MKQLEDRDDSNAARKSTNHGPTEGDTEIKGFVLAAYPDTGPAQFNHEIKSNGDSIGAEALGNNEGTSRDAYEFQPDGNPAEGDGDVK